MSFDEIGSGIGFYLRQRPEKGLDFGTGFFKSTVGVDWKRDDLKWYRKAKVREMEGKAASGVVI